MKHSHIKQSGFTLVELSIVLVIIGLIVGGVLAGQDLIKAAEQRAAIGQIEKMDTVANAFRSKYNGIPGDILSPANFGFSAVSAATATMIQGNGVVEGETATFLSGEAALFFADLAKAGLINENLGSVATADTHTGTVVTIDKLAPLSKFGKGIYLWVNSNAGTNYYLMDNASVGTTGAVTHGYTAMTPTMAYNMDAKLDDSNPSTGKVTAILDVTALANSSATTSNAASTAGKCVMTGTPDIYQTNSSTTGNPAETGACAIKIKASF